MYLQVFGLADAPAWWFLSRIPAGGGAELSRMLSDIVQTPVKLKFYCNEVLLNDLGQEELIDLWAHEPAQLIAKPYNADQPRHLDPQLQLVTTSGPDAGRIFPLTRRNLSVGRGGARAQVRDPWLSGHHFDIRLSSNGTLLTPAGQSPRVWEHDAPFLAGSTHFDLQRGPGRPLKTPRDPEHFEITPGQPPSPPNLLLQIIGAAAPLLIGIVLMFVTGMWYFLLFSGISVIIAGVMITQYRRAKRKYISAIRSALDHTAQRLSHSSFAPHEMTHALKSQVNDPLNLEGTQPDHPVITLGTSVRQAEIAHVQDTKQWEPYLYHRVNCLLRLAPGCRTIVIGDPASRRPLKNWLIAQVLRHISATQTGLAVEGVHIGGTRIVVITEGGVPQPAPDLHHLIFVDAIDGAADEYTTIIDLKTRTIEGPFTSTALIPFGISTSTLEWYTKELLLDQPPDDSQLEHLSLSKLPWQTTATQQMLTTLGTGQLGLTIDLVRDGPHALITGTTGAGKSELLLTLLVGIAHRYQPCDVSLVLLDFKGGSSFNVLAPLPHTMGVETNHVAMTSFRSLEAIAAELYRREALFAEHGVADFEAFRRACPTFSLPRLVVAIDEVRVLVDQNPEAASTLAHLAATGRSLGFHLILATQRTQGAVSTDIRANIGCTIALRTATEHDSWDVLGTADAFRISPNTPGRAYFKVGAGKPVMFQTARYLLDDEPVVLLPHRPDTTELLPMTTNWPQVVEELRRRASAFPLPAPIILPALEDRIEVASLRDRFGSGRGYTPIGLVDDPAHCNQYPIGLGTVAPTSDLRLLSKSVAWIGGADSGIDECAHVVFNHVLTSSKYAILLDARQLCDAPSGWDQQLDFDAATADALQTFFENLATILTHGTETTIVLTEWGSWASAAVSGSFYGFEERLIQLMRQFASILTVYVFGARELAGGRLLAMIPDRFYIPKNSSAEHQLLWPTLVPVPAVKARAVLVTADNASGGLEVQLCTD